MLLTYRKLVLCLLWKEIWNKDFSGRLDKTLMAIAKGCSLSRNGIYSLIFIQETDMLKLWHATGIRDFSWRLSVAEIHGQLSVTSGRGRLVHGGQKPASKDQWPRMPGGEEQKKDKLNPMGLGFVDTPRKYVKGCLYSWTHLLPLPSQETETFSKHQKNKPGILASSSRPPNSVQITIFEGKISPSLVFAIKIKSKSCVCDEVNMQFVEPRYCLIWPVIEQHAMWLKQNKKPCLFMLKRCLFPQTADFAVESEISFPLGAKPWNCKDSQRETDSR